jgi:uroporphyrin-III C-methyltransferase
MHQSHATGAAAQPGTVFLVGAGPGDPGLLTLRAAELLAGATEVFYDYLVSDGVLALCGAGARLVNVGKIGHGPATAQRDIEQRLIASARAGHRVVRLKGGDPLLFGRGAEEALALEAAGVRFEIVPGVSSALAVPACAGIPVTARGHASSVAIVTGHSLAGGPAPIPAADTIVVLMGVSNAAAIRDQLIATGLAPDTPAAVIERGTCAGQRTIAVTLAELPAAIAREQIGAPAVLVIGEVVRLRGRLDWRSRTESASGEGCTSPSLHALTTTNV